MGIHTDFTPDIFTTTRPKYAQEILRRDQERRRKIRQEIIATIPSREDGINVRRVENFFATLGLPVADYLVVSDEHVTRIRNICANHEDEATVKFLDKGPWGGFYVSGLGIAFVNHSMYTYWDRKFGVERILVHELGHGSSLHYRATRIEDGRAQGRLGFATGKDINDPKGWFLEEAFAELLVGMYAKQHASDEARHRIRTNLLNDANHPDPLEGIPHEVPAKYLEYGADGLWYRDCDGVFAAYGIELLCKRVPKLLLAMLSARNELSALRWVARLIDHISPGLYAKLRNLAYSEIDFRKGLVFIKEAINQQALAHIA